MIRFVPLNINQKKLKSERKIRRKQGEETKIFSSSFQKLIISNTSYNLSIFQQFSLQVFFLKIYPPTSMKKQRLIPKG